jgi:hypothetical protein
MDEVRPLLQCYTAQLVAGMDLAAVLAAHRGAPVTEDDLIAALIVRLQVPMTATQVDTCLQAAAEVLASSDSDSELDELELDEPEPEPGSDRPLRLPTCNCETCMQARVCYANFGNLEPDPGSRPVVDAILRAAVRAGIRLPSLRAL